MPQQTYRRDLDGLRAVAILGVLLFHLGKAVPGGFMGVDVFFVLSGYLITGNLIIAKESNQLSLVTFFEKRIRRIFPAMWLMMVATIVAGYLLMLPREFSELANSVLYQLVSLSNVFFWSRTGYFSGPADTKPLLHTWSLAIEEQFYLLLPIAFYFLSRLSPAKQFSFFAFAMILGCATCIAVTPSMPSFSFFWLPTRCWELLTGTTLAYLVRRQTSVLVSTSWLDQTLATIGSLILAFAFFGFGIAGSSSTWSVLGIHTFPGWISLFPVLGTAVLIWSHHRSAPWTYWVLSNRVMVSIGGLSYSLYLWHWPVHVFLQSLSSSALPWMKMAMEFAVTTVLSVVSFYSIERPFRRFVALRGKRLIVVVALMTLCLGLPAGWIVMTDGAKFRYSKNQQFIIDMTAFSESHQGLERPPRGMTDLPQIGDRSAVPSFAVWGDSHATALSGLFDELGRRHGVSGVIASKGGIPPALGTRRLDLTNSDNDLNDLHNQSVVNILAQSNIEFIFLISAWDTYIHEHGFESRNERNSQRSLSDSERLLFAGIQASVSRLQNRESRIFFLHQAPRQPIELIRQIQSSLIKNSLPNLLQSRVKFDHEKETRGFRSLIGSNNFRSFEVIDPAIHCFDERGRSRVVANRLPLYTDHHHLSVAGCVEFYKEEIESVIKQIAEVNSQR